MKKKTNSGATWSGAGGLVIACAVACSACSSSSHAAAEDAGKRPDASGPVVQHVLVTYDGTGSKSDPSTMFAVNLTTHDIDGKLQITDTEAITDTSNAVAPFVLEQGEDKVVEVDPSSWTAAGTWSVALPGDAGGLTADPYAVSVATDSKVYVIRYNTNVVDVIDITSPSGNGKPTGTIDLTPLAQPKGDGVVHAAAAVYVASSQLVYVALQNINLNPAGEEDYMGTYDTLCVGTTSSIIAIDTASDSVKSLGGAAPGGGIALQGFDPTSLTYDSVGGQLFAFHAGCHTPPKSDAGDPGTLQQAGIEAVDLAKNTSQLLLDTSSVTGFPASFVYVSPQAAVVGFQYPAAAYLWNPEKSTLGTLLSNAPDFFDLDANGNLVGAVVVPSDKDGGASTTNIVSLSLDSMTLTTLQKGVISLGGEGYIASVGVWPRVTSASAP